jgi:DNA-binding phage protein
MITEVTDLHEHLFDNLGSTASTPVPPHPALSKRDFYVTLTCMVVRETGAQRYFASREEASAEYREALEEARTRIAAVDRVVETLDAQRRALGLSKAELARRAGMRPEVVRRLLGASPRNPTLSTVVSLANVLALDVTVTTRSTVNRKRSAAS